MRNASLLRATVLNALPCVRQRMVDALMDRLKDEVPASQHARLLRYVKKTCRPQVEFISDHVRQNHLRSAFVLRRVHHV